MSGSYWDVTMCSWQGGQADRYWDVTTCSWQSAPSPAPQPPPVIRLVDEASVASLPAQSTAAAAEPALASTS